MKYRELWNDENWTRSRKVPKIQLKVEFQYLAHARQVEKRGYNFLVFYTFTDCGFYKLINGFKNLQNKAVIDCLSSSAHRD